MFETLLICEVLQKLYLSKIKPEMHLDYMYLNKLDCTVDTVWKVETNQNFLFFWDNWS